MFVLLQFFCLLDFIHTRQLRKINCQAVYAFVQGYDYEWECWDLIHVPKGNILLLAELTEGPDDTSHGNCLHIW